MQHARFCLLLGVSLVGWTACSRGEVPPGPTPDLGPGPEASTDQGDPPIPDGPRPDRGPPPDAGPPCGNGWLDTDEACDKAIPAGQLGACPTDCDDGNDCTVDTVVGSVEDCSATCEHQVVADCCGNGVQERNEACDDGNTIETDSCNKQCELPGGHLLLTEIAISPTVAEFIEIFNPANEVVALDQIYLGDREDYCQLPAGGFKGVGSDFIARFPDGAEIEPGGFVVVATSGVDYKTTYGSAADFELRPTDDTPDMVQAADKTLGAVAGLTDAGEMVVLFGWDGQADTVQDIDYLVWAATTVIAKTTATCVDGPDADTDATCYLDDTPGDLQSNLAPPKTDGSLHRCDFTEGKEASSGGNGQLGHDETSEDFENTWQPNQSTADDRTPGAAPPDAICAPQP